MIEWLSEALGFWYWWTQKIEDTKENENGEGEV